MKVITELRVADIFMINVRNYFASRARYVVSLLIAVAYGVFLISDLGVPADRRAWLIYIAGGVVFAIAFFVLFLILGVLNAIVMARHTSGVLGPHELHIVPEGLRDITPVTETLTRWAAIVRITRAGDYLSFWISPYLAHVVPRRAFADAESFAAFEGQALRYLNGEKAAPVAAPVATVNPPLPREMMRDDGRWRRPGEPAVS